MAGLGLGVGSASTSDGTTMVAKGAAITPAAKRLFTREPKRERRVSIFLSSQLAQAAKQIATTLAIPIVRNTPCLARSR